VRALKLPVEVGIWDTEYTARLYTNHIVVRVPCVKWQGNTGTLSFKKHNIARVKGDFAYMLNEEQISAFWAWLGEQLDDSYLKYQGF
jgi:hypothetical protein